MFEIFTLFLKCVLAIAMAVMLIWTPYALKRASAQTDRESEYVRYWRHY